MMDINRVTLAGRVMSVNTRETKNQKKFMVLSLVTNKRTQKGMSEPTYVNVMIFNERLVEHINKIEVGKGYFCIVDGFISNYRIGKVKAALTVVANDVNIAVRTNADEDAPSTENAIMEDFDEYDF